MRNQREISTVRKVNCMEDLKLSKKLVIALIWRGLIKLHIRLGGN